MDFAIDPILTQLPSFDATTVQNQFRKVTDRATLEPVAIKRHSRPEWVIMPAEEYVRLEKVRRAPLEELTAQFDQMVERMNTPEAEKAVQALFTAGPAELGRAAVKAAATNGH